VRVENWLLQGMITCGLCGFSFRAEKTRQRRYYNCRGKLSIKHLDGSPRCTSPRLRAEWLEDQVWQRILTIINDPNKLEGLITDTIESLKNKTKELQERLMPVNEQLSHITEQKARLADEWIMINIDPAKYKETKKELDKEESRLKAIQSSIDPAQLEELESTRSMLSFWNNQLKSMAWNLENENGSKVRLVDKPHETALRIVGTENIKLGEMMGFPASRRELLEKLQVQLVVFNDRINVNSIFPVVPVGYPQCTSDW
jgi:site-specific DNA recombinase